MDQLREHVSHEAKHEYPLLIKLCVPIGPLDEMFKESGFFCPGDGARMRVDAERQFAQAAQEKTMLEEKLVQAERSAILTLNNKEQIHREQLEGERRLKVG